MIHPLDGCPEKDALLIELVLTGEADAGLRNHLDGCSRCRKAEEAYRTSARAIDEALTGKEPEAVTDERAVVKHRRSRLLTAAAVIILASLATAATTVLWSEFGGWDDADAPSGREGSSTRQGDVESSRPAALRPGRPVETGTRSSAVLLGGTPEDAAARARDDSRDGSVEESPYGPITIRGVVRDHRTKGPVPGAEVSYGRQHVLDRSDPHFELATALTDAQGRFEATTRLLAEGERELSPLYDWASEGAVLLVRSPDHALRWLNPWDATEFNVGLLPGARVSGVVETPDGIPVADALLLVNLFFDGSHPFRLTQGIEGGRTDSDGTFTLDFRLGVTDLHFPVLLFAVSERGVGWTHLAVVEGQETIDGARIEIRNASPLTVLVRDEDGVPASGITVRAEPRFDPLGSSSPGDHALHLGYRSIVRRVFSARTDGEGLVHLPVLPPQDRITSYDIVAEDDARTLWSWADDVSLAEKDPREITLTLQPFRPCRIEGTVVDSRGDAIFGASVMCGRWSRGMFVSGVSTLTGEDGSFTLLPPDQGEAEVLVHLEAPGFVRKSESVALSPVADVKTTIVLERAGSITGRVVDSNGAPVEGAHVFLHNSPQRVMNATDEGGRFEIQEVGPSRRGLRAIAPTTPPSTTEGWGVAPLVPARAGDTDVTIVLPRLRIGLAVIRARILDEAGRPCDPALAELMAPRTGNEAGWAPSGNSARAHGLVTIQRVPPGTWRLWVESPGYAHAWGDLEVTETDVEIDLDIRMAGHARISGIVLSTTGALPSYVHWKPAGDYGLPSAPLWWEGPVDLQSHARVDATGRFEMEGVAPGRIRLWASQPGLAGEAIFDVRPEVQNDARLEVHPTAALRLRTEGPSPGEVAHLWIHRDGGWRCVKQLGFPEPRPLDTWINVEEPTVQWRVEFLVDNFYKTSSAAETQEGEAQLRVGETTTVVVPVVPIRE